MSPTSTSPSGWRPISPASVGLLKIGLELFWARGPEAVRRIGAHGPVFVDCKLHDIPTTVERASANVGRLGVAMFNVHALGGDAMMRAAVEGARRGADEAGVATPLVVAVTVLSSIGAERSRRPRRSRGRRRRQDSTAWSCRARTCATCARCAARTFCLVVPGIRPAGTNGHDQVRVLTPREAIERGADYSSSDARSPRPRPGRRRARHPIGLR